MATRFLICYAFDCFQLDMLSCSILDLMDSLTEISKWMILLDGLFGYLFGFSIKILLPFLMGF